MANGVQGQMQKPVATAPVAGAAKDVVAGQPGEKKSKLWLWIIIILILVAVGVGIWFFLR